MVSLKKKILGVFHNKRVENWVDWLDGYVSESSHLLRVLTYHRVDEFETDPRLYPGGISATPREFARQMEFLSKRFRFVHIDEVIDAIVHRAPLPERAVLLTFDDAYVDFQRNAWPVLKSLGLPAVLFVPTAYPNNSHLFFWWDRLYRVIHSVPAGQKLKTPIGTWTIENNHRQIFRTLRDDVKSKSHKDLQEIVDQIADSNPTAPPETNSVLGWDELRRLKADGLVLGAHTETHPLINRISLEEARREVVNSQKKLIDETGDARPIFAYPSGGFSDQTTAMLHEERFQLAFTTRRGINDIKVNNPLCLRRINVGANTSRSLLQAQLLSPARRLNRFWS